MKASDAIEASRAPVQDLKLKIWAIKDECALTLGDEQSERDTLPWERFDRAKEKRDAL